MVPSGILVRDFFSHWFYVAFRINNVVYLCIVNSRANCKSRASHSYGFLHRRTLSYWHRMSKRFFFCSVFSLHLMRRKSVSIILCPWYFRDSGIHLLLDILFTTSIKSESLFGSDDVSSMTWWMDELLLNFRWKGGDKRDIAFTVEEKLDTAPARHAILFLSGQMGSNRGPPYFGLPKWYLLLAWSEG